MWGLVLSDFIPIEETNIPKSNYLKTRFNPVFYQCYLPLCIAVFIFSQDPIGFAGGENRRSTRMD